MRASSKPPMVGDLVFYHFETLPEDRETGRKAPVWVGWVAGITGREWGAPVLNIIWHHSTTPGGFDVSWRDFQMQQRSSLGRGYELVRAKRSRAM